MACLLCALFWIFAVAVGVKIFLKLRLKSVDTYTCLVGKTAIVTGANTGIGYATALDFAKRGCRVILACRNKTRAESAVYNIIKETGNQNVLYKLVDLSSLKSVRDFAEDFNNTEERLDILVNNAGGIGFENKLSDDGLQLILQINHVGPFLLTHLLLDKLKKSGYSRVVNVASKAAKFAGNIDLKQLNVHPKDASGLSFPMMMYANTKLCNILFTTELARRLEGTTVTTNTLHPGAINTDFFARVPYIKSFRRIVAKMYFRTPEEGARTTIFVALSKKLEGVSGKLFDNCQEIKMYSNARDPSLAKSLWMMSEEWAKLKENEKIKSH